MKTILFATFFLAGLCSNLSANNISITNVTLTGQNTTAGTNNSANYAMVKFSVAWENSWRVSLTNWDAAWVFVKYRIGNNGNWQHVQLNNDGHLAPLGSKITAGLLRPDTTFNLNTNPGIGAFIYRDADGSGTFTASNVQLRWNYGAQGLSDNAQIEVKVFAIEMVYVPQGAFAAGDGGLGSTYPLTTINTGIINTTSSGSGSLGGKAGGYPPSETVPFSTGWPNGYNAYYCMKYEISQQQYIDFLNSLTKPQQNVRVESDISQATVSNVYVMSISNSIQNRNAIRAPSSLPTYPTPVTFFCDYNGSNSGGDPDDGKWIACNYLKWGDVSAYFDWSGLRPMTEMEFEKSCRGTLPSVIGEYAWGSPSIIQSTSLNNSGTTSETTNPSNANSNCNFSGNPINGPVRVGAFAKTSSSRISSGASYYGAMEMTGNLWEITVTSANIQGRNFSGLHGDGVLTFDGDQNVSNWPNYSTGLGSGMRGGGWGYQNPDLQVSDRSEATVVNGSRGSYFGGRGVRSVQ